jgi:hypothetical protein
LDYFPSVFIKYYIWIILCGKALAYAAFGVAQGYIPMYSLWSAYHKATESYYSGSSGLVLMINELYSFPIQQDQFSVKFIVHIFENERFPESLHLFRGRILPPEKFCYGIFWFATFERLVFSNRKEQL